EIDREEARCDCLRVLIAQRPIGRLDQLVDLELDRAARHQADESERQRRRHPDGEKRLYDCPRDRAPPHVAEVTARVHGDAYLGLGRDRRRHRAESTASSRSSGISASDANLRSARDRSMAAVSAFGTTTHSNPASFAAVIPFLESSNATASCGATPSAFTAARYRSGAGFVRATSSRVRITSHCGWSSSRSRWPSTQAREELDATASRRCRRFASTTYSRTPAITSSAAISSVLRRSRRALVVLASKPSPTSAARWPAGSKPVSLPM